MNVLIQVLTKGAPMGSWVMGFLAGILAITVLTLLLYLGVALIGVLRAVGADQEKIRYRVFCDLLAFFYRKRRR